MKRAIVWIAAGSLLAVACSSTPTSTEVVPESLTESPPGTAPAETSAPPPAPDATRDATPGSTAANTGPTAPPPGSSDPGRVKQSIDYGPPAQGITDATVKIGIWLLNTDSGCNAIGATGRTPGCGTDDDHAEVKALTDWVNAKGGVAGRTLEVVIHETLANNSSWVAQAESACEAFAVDHKVFLAMSEGQLGRPHFVRCMAEKGVPVIDPGFWAWDSKDYKDLFPFLYQPSRPRADRWLKVYADGLAAQGFFNGDVTVGLFRYDSPTHTRATQDVLLPRLRAHGIDQVEQGVLRTPTSVAALGDMNAELSSHILRFKTLGVNRVLFFTGTGEFHFFYFSQADSQDFNPRYGLSSYDYMTLSTDNAPEGQLDGARGVGWAPGFDTPRHKDPGLNAAARTCKRLMEKAGVDDPWKGRNTKCDAYFFLKHVLDNAPALNALGLRATVDALGKSFQPAAVFATRFAKGRYDGPSVWRPMSFRQSCNCLVYTGGTSTF